MRGLRCPMPLLKTKQLMRQMAVGERVRVEATDVGSQRDIPLFAKKEGHHLERIDTQDEVICFWIIKGGTSD